MAKKKTGGKGKADKRGQSPEPGDSPSLKDVIAGNVGDAGEIPTEFPEEKPGPMEPIDVGDVVVEGETGELGLGEVTGEPGKPKDPLEAMTEERDGLKDQLLRALADVENMRRRTEKETAQARKYGHSAFARDLLGAVDNLGRAVEALPADRKGLDEATRNLVVGVEMTAKEIGEVMERNGITRIDAMGEKFDPDRHQAMFEVPTAEAEPGTVVEVARPGWMLHDRLLSPAMVGVAKKPGEGESPKG